LWHKAGMIEIREFDPDLASRAQWTAFHGLRRVRAEAEEPGEPVTEDADLEQELRRPGPIYENHRILAWHGADAVGLLGWGCRRPTAPAAEASRPYLYAWGGVRPSWRRRGVATALLRALLAIMRAREKTIATIGSSLPEGQAFLAAIGAVEKNRSIVNRLDLDRLDWDDVARWHAAAIPQGSGLTWEIHEGRVPLDRLAELMPVFTELFRDVPMGSLDLPPIRYELPSYLSWYEDMDRRGGDHLLVVLRDGDAVAGLCEATWSPHFPDRAAQELTAVARPWRNRGLAKGMKAAMLQLVRRRHPQVRLMSTGNAEGNAPMLAINRRLGFAEYRRDISYQIGRETLAAWLAARPQTD
jgi:GNAT superfamily N-acetyltransferase